MIFQKTAAAIVVIAALAVSAFGEESVRGFTHMADIDARRGAGQHTVAVELYPGVKLDTPPAVTDQAGNVVPSEILFNKEYGKLIVAFDASSGDSNYTLHFGGRGSADRPRTRWQAEPSLLLETRPRPNGPINTFRNVRKLFAQTENSGYGADFVGQIFSAYNPFGPSDSFISVFRGYFVLEKDTNARIFTASSDASFVVIDREPAFEWPGVHAVDAGLYGNFGKDMSLKAGRHSIEYYHVQMEGTPYMCLGWKKEGDKAVSVFPSSLFEQTPMGYVSKIRRSDGSVTAHFDWTQGELMRFGDYHYIMYRFKPDVEGDVDSYQWDFGDNITSTEAKPQHVFTGQQPYYVSLTVKRGEQEDICRIAVPMKTPMSNVVVTDREVLDDFAEVIQTYDYDKLDGPDLIRFFELLENLEKPLLLAPICEIIKEKSSSPILRARANRILAKAYSITDPKKAIPMLRELSNSRDSATAIEAKVDLIEIYLHHLDAPDKAEEMAITLSQVTDSKSKLGRLARVKRGDVYLMKGELDKAEEYYRTAQELAQQYLEDLNQTEVEVRDLITLRQGGYAGTVNSYIQQNRLRAARDMLLEWEADYPVSKITGDFILMSSRYWEAVGDAKRALDDMKCLLKINPLTPYLPQIEYRMANAYRDLGDTEKAKALYKKVINEYPLNPVVADARAALQSLR